MRPHLPLEQDRHLKWKSDMGEYFNKLRQFRDGVDFDTSATDGAYQLAKQKLGECREALELFRENPGLKGQTWNAASQWLSQYESDLTTLTESLDTTKTSYDTARAIMSSAKAEAGEVSSELISSAERSMFAGEDGIEVNGTVMTGAQYTSYIYQQRDAERERVSKDILDRMNAAVEEQARAWARPPGHSEGVDTSAQGSAYSGGQASARLAMQKTVMPPAQMISAQSGLNSPNPNHIDWTSSRSPR